MGGFEAKIAESPQHFGDERDVSKQGWVTMMVNNSAYDKIAPQSIR
jgi:hypothetical protein